jgi:hypothetical protein
MRHHKVSGIPAEELFDRFKQNARLKAEKHFLFVLQGYIHSQYLVWAM